VAGSSIASAANDFVDALVACGRHFHSQPVTDGKKAVGSASQQSATIRE